MIILIMGLPGNGKTFLAKALYNRMSDMNVKWFNADAIREQFDDWDFTYEGRLRQSERMGFLSSSHIGISIIDMVAPLPEFRDVIRPDILIWVNTNPVSIYEDTNSMFIPPEACDIEVTEQNADKWSKIILNRIRVRLNLQL